MVYEKAKILNFLLNISEKSLHTILSEGFNIENQNKNLQINKRLINKEYLKEPNKTIFDLILNCSIECQKNFSDGSVIFFELLKDHIISKNSFDIINTNLLYQKNLNFEKTKIKKEYIDILLNTEEFIHLNQDTKTLIKTALENSDRSSRFACKPSKNSNYLLEFDTGFKFKIKEENNFKKQTENLSTFIVILDAFIENVSEIHFLLTKASETKDNVLILCRGASLDVLNTIKINQARNSINLSLIIIPFDELNLNKLKDVSIVSSNNNILMSSKGDTLSGLDYRLFNKVDKVTIDRNFFTIENNKINKQDLDNHVNFLIEKISENNLNLEMSKIFIDRLESFNSKQTTISIPEKPTQQIEILLCNLFFKRISEIINSELVLYKNFITSSNCFDFAENKLNSLFELLNNTNYVLVNKTKNVEQ
jgi:hypothetical protein